jgi:recombination associated protein RdgC
MSPGAAMTTWLSEGEAPAGFTLDRDLELRAPGDLQIKRLAFLDILKEEAEGQAEGREGRDEERFDIDFALMSGELAKLLAALVEALGGEMPESP